MTARRRAGGRHFQTARGSTLRQRRSVGERLTLWRLEEKDGPEVFTIVGVTADFVGGLSDAPGQQILVPLAQHPASNVFLVARSAAGIQPTTLTSAFQNAVRDLDPDFTRRELISREIS